MSSEWEFVLLKRCLGLGWQHLNTLIYPFVWQNVHIPALLNLKSFLSWFWSFILLCSQENLSLICTMKTVTDGLLWNKRGGGGRDCVIRSLPRRWQPRDGCVGGAAPTLPRCWLCWEIQALASAVTHESATVTLRGEAFRLLNFKLDFCLFSQLAFPIAVQGICSFID